MKKQVHMIPRPNIACRWLSLATFLLMTSPSSSTAQDGNLEMGRLIADEYCSVCHNIQPTGPFKLETPSFAAIAKYRSVEQVRRRIVTPIHQRMPRYKDYMIGGNIDDMVAYIMSLEK
jgi:mono/diheme cytochrome c family protein